MNFFKRKESSQSAPQQTLSVYDLLLQRKIVVSRPTAVAKILQTWENCNLWKWRISGKNKGPHGIPNGLYNGIHYIDKLMSGKPLATGSIYSSDELYGPYIKKEWQTTEIIKAILEYDKAANSSDYAPISPEDKARLQKRNIADFFYAGYIDAKPSAYIHAPFLYFFKNGAAPAITSVSLKTPINQYLFDRLCNHYCSTYGLPLSNVEKNRIVTFADTLYHWYDINSQRLAPGDRRLDIIVEAWQAYLNTWSVAPQSAIPTVGKVATETVLSSLQKRATYTERTIVKNVSEQQQTGCSILPTTVLSDAAPDGNYLGILVAYCLHNDVEFDPKSVDSCKLAAYGNLQVRQALRQYRLGTFTCTQPAKRNWQEVLNKYGG